MTALQREEVRILWRQALLATPEGQAWLIEQARKGTKERDLGPHKFPEIRP